MTEIQVEPRFKRMLEDLPEPDQSAALDAIANPEQPARHLKRVKSRRLRKNTWSIRVGNFAYRAFAERHGNLFSWYWIGTREAANNLL